MQVKQYARQKNQFLRGEEKLASSLKSSFMTGNSQSRAGLYSSANQDAGSQNDISVLFKPLDLNQSMQRAKSGLRSTKKISTDKLLGNKSQFLLSQNVTMCGLDEGAQRDPQQTFVHPKTFAFNTDFTSTPVQQSSKTTSRNQIPKKTKFIQKKKQVPDERPGIPDHVEVGFNGTFQGPLGG